MISWISQVWRVTIRTNDSNRSNTKHTNVIIAGYLSSLMTTQKIKHVNFPRFIVTLPGELSQHATNK